MAEIIEKETLLKYAGQSKTAIAIALKVGFARVEQSAIRHGINHLLVKTEDATLFMPSKGITYDQIKPYYGGGLSVAAKGLGVPLSSLQVRVQYLGLRDKFTAAKNVIKNRSTKKKKQKKIEPEIVPATTAKTKESIIPNRIIWDRYERGTVEFWRVAIQYAPPEAWQMPSRGDLVS